MGGHGRFSEIHKSSVLLLKVLKILQVESSIKDGSDDTEDSALGSQDRDDGDVDGEEEEEGGGPDEEEAPPEDGAGGGEETEGTGGGDEEATGEEAQDQEPDEGVQADAAEEANGKEQ